MKAATSEECCRAFMEWASRYGLPHVAISDNGNTFVANLYRDIMRTFNIKVTFTPAYHAATNGAIEKRHQTIKNSLKASLIDMGNIHGDKWTSALPWVLLGKRIQVQPDLDISAAQLVFGKSLSIPGQMLGHPGTPLSNLQTKALLEELYRLSAQPSVPTSTIVDPIDISKTESAKHVYIKVEDPAPLAPRFEGPYEIVSRPSRSTITVRVGSFVDGRPRLQTYNWNLAKIAHLRDDAECGERPKLGRPAAARSNKEERVPDPPDIQSSNPSDSVPSSISKQTPPNSAERGKIQTSFNTLSGKPPHPDYIRRGPLITEEMFNKWTPELLGIDPKTTRPTRTTRNPNPRYVDSIHRPWSASVEEINLLNQQLHPEVQSLGV